MRFARPADASNRIARRHEIATRLRAEDYPREGNLRRSPRSTVLNGVTVAFAPGVRLAMLSTSFDEFKPGDSAWEDSNSAPTETPSTEATCDNRRAPTRLAQIASVLDVSVGEFFESSRARPPSLNSPVHLPAEPGAWRVLKAYARAPTPRVRYCIAKLVESLADQTSTTKATVARLNTVDLAERRKFPSRG